MKFILQPFVMACGKGTENIFYLKTEEYPAFGNKYDGILKFTHWQ
jgi:hypothetical protein